MTTLLLVAVGIALPAVIFDLLERRIPNTLILSALFLGPAAVFWEAGLEGMFYGLAAGLIAFSIAFLFWLVGWLGAGDVKLIGALGVLVGLPEIGIYLLNVALLGAVLGLFYLVLKGRARESWERLNYMLAARERQLERTDSGQAAAVNLPYAIAIGTGAIFTMMGVSPMI
ncbi:A24 family peptidase [Alcanivorax sediminis]|uniref:Prepilin type IV endopeptidase peptidase domain-containing protein n=1 Tax=Alcanivorax sediminis TaxID=2663008 RepID=A0A6N7LV76_9GAMM|nr:prepilin peptidase [Alcanivorax sediminis]MQX52975.1 hypothetical protein [Alcanivorax sediminis]